MGWRDRARSILLPAPPEPSGRGGRDWPDLAMWPTVLAVLVLRHVWWVVHANDFAHFEVLTDAFQSLLEGQPFTTDVEFWTTGISVSSTIFLWLHLPLLWFDNPVVGTHLLYLLWEALAIVGWIVVGRRSQLDRDVVWVSALLLAWYPYSKLVVCENMTVACFIAVGAFIALQRGVEGRGWASMVPAGVLFTAMVLVHHALVLLAPAAVVFLVGSRLRNRQALARVAAGLGIGAVFVVGLGLEWGEVGGLAERLRDTLGRLVDEFDAAKFAATVRMQLLFPLGAAGALLAIARWRLGHAAPAEKLAILWFVTGAPLLAWAISYLNEPASRSAHFAGIYPARAILSATLLVWAAHGLLHRLPAIGRFRPRTTDVVLSAGIVAVLLLANGIQDGAADSRDEWAEIVARAEPCDLDSSRSQTRMLLGWYDRIVEHEEPRTAPRHDRLLGPENGHFWQAFFWWAWRTRPFAPPPGEATDGSPDARGVTVVLPPTLYGPDGRALSTASLDGANDYGSMVVLPEVVELAGRAHARQRRFGPIPGEGSARTLMVGARIPRGGFAAIETDDCDDGIQHNPEDVPPFDLVLVDAAGARRSLEPAGWFQCARTCEAHIVWMAFRLPETLGDGAVAELVALSSSGGDGPAQVVDWPMDDPDDSWAVLLPPLPGPEE